jgi:hypothetical protein
MRCHPTHAAILALPLALAACGNGGNLARTFGLSRDAPDEFRVTTQAPLSMPPDFALRPPEPGAPRPQAQSDTRQAEEALVPNVALGQGAGSMSPGQEALVAAAGPSAPRNIAARVDSEAARLDNNSSFVDRLMFWRTPAQPGVVVDPTREAQRLRENAALGQSPAAGDTPIIQPQASGGPLTWLGNLF